VKQYNNYKELNQNARIDIDYTVDVREGASGVVVMAVHGGGIEPGTGALADAVAGRVQHGFYAFRGLLPSGNRILHVKSHRFDEPRALELVQRYATALAIHGCSGSDARVYIGGRHRMLASQIGARLKAAGFFVSDNPAFAGVHPLNICNRCRSGAGVQLELTTGLRRQMFAGSLQSGSRKTTAAFDRFVVAVRRALRVYCEPP